MEARLIWLPLRALLDPTWVPWVPTRSELIDLIFGLSQLGEDDVFYDLGAGDGRIVVEAAKRGAKLAVGIERDRDLYVKALELAEREGVSHKTRFINGDFFTADISEATVVYMYLLTRVNKMLAPKLVSELRVGTRIVSLDFEIPGWRPVEVLETQVAGRSRRLFLYIRGLSEPPEYSLAAFFKPAWSMTTRLP